MVNILVFSSVFQMQVEIAIKAFKLSQKKVSLMQTQMSETLYMKKNWFFCVSVFLVFNLVCRKIQSQDPNGRRYPVRMVMTMKYVSSRVFNGYDMN